MKVVIPVAGKGTRLLPLTKEVPKPLVTVAGRPVALMPVELVENALLHILEHLQEQRLFIGKVMKNGAGGRAGSRGQFGHGRSLETVAGKKPRSSGKDCIPFGHMVPLSRKNQPNDQSVFP